MTYPEATIRLPGCRKSLTVTGIPHSVTLLYTLKMVPMLTFTSMLLLPSSGSNMQTYLDCELILSSKGTKSLSSSLAIPAQLIPCRNTPTIWSLANSSSFFTSSPCTFCLPASPRISTNPALFTSTLIRLAASPISRRSPDNSPVSCGKALISLMVNSSSVRTRLLVVGIKNFFNPNKNKESLLQE